MNSATSKDIRDATFVHAMVHNRHLRTKLLASPDVLTDEHFDLYKAACERFRTARYGMPLNQRSARILSLFDELQLHTRMVAAVAKRTTKRPADAIISNDGALSGLLSDASCPSWIYEAWYACQEVYQTCERLLASVALEGHEVRRSMADEWAAVELELVERNPTCVGGERVRHVSSQLHGPSYPGCHSRLHRACSNVCYGSCLRDESIRHESRRWISSG